MWGVGDRRATPAPKERAMGEAVILLGGILGVRVGNGHRAAVRIGHSPKGEI